MKSSLILTSQFALVTKAFQSAISQYIHRFSATILIGAITFYARFGMLREK